MIRKILSPAVAAIVTLVALALWLALNVAGILPSSLAQFQSSLPVWFPTANLLLVPSLPALTGLRSRLPLWSRALLFVVLLLSLSGLHITYESYPNLTIGVMLFYIFECFWIIPKVNQALTRYAQPSK